PTPALHPFPTRRSSDLIVPDPMTTARRIANVMRAPHPPFGHEIPRPAKRGEGGAERRVRGAFSYIPREQIRIRLLQAFDEVLPRSEEHTSELQSRSELV